MSDRDWNPATNADRGADAETPHPTGWVGVVAGLGLVIAAGVGLHVVMLYIGVPAAAVSKSFTRFWPEVLVVAVVATPVAWLFAGAITRLTAETTTKHERGDNDE